ncbi:hypothetical protein IWZ00DRAFT_187930 [Phyllosticta capitalensis]|uniref:uncharacterized protein n=1 Tax=Phyllosticta capitalensis TaxID=121624 RepID=UPI003131849D
MMENSDDDFSGVHTSRAHLIRKPSEKDGDTTLRPGEQLANELTDSNITGQDGRAMANPDVAMPGVDGSAGRALKRKERADSPVDGSEEQKRPRHERKDNSERKLDFEQQVARVAAILEARGGVSDNDDGVLKSFRRVVAEQGFRGTTIARNMAIISLLEDNLNRLEAINKTLGIMDDQDLDVSSACCMHMTTAQILHGSLSSLPRTDFADFLEHYVLEKQYETTHAKHKCAILVENILKLRMYVDQSPHFTLARKLKERMIAALGAHATPPDDKRGDLPEPHGGENLHTSSNQSFGRANTGKATAALADQQPTVSDEACSRRSPLVTVDEEIPKPTRSQASGKDHKGLPVKEVEYPRTEDDNKAIMVPLGEIVPASNAHKSSTWLLKVLVKDVERLEQLEKELGAKDGDNRSERTSYISDPTHSLEGDCPEELADYVKLRKRNRLENERMVTESNVRQLVLCLDNSGHTSGVRISKSLRRRADRLLATQTPMKQSDAFKLVMSKVNANASKESSAPEN